MKYSNRNSLKTGMPLPWDLVLSRGQIRFRKGTPITEEILRLIKESKIVEMTLDCHISKPEKESAEERMKSSVTSEKNLQRMIVINNARKAISEDLMNQDDPFYDYFVSLKNIWDDPSTPLDLNVVLGTVDRWIEHVVKTDANLASIGWHHDVENFLPMHMMNVSRFLTIMAFELDMDNSLVKDMALASMLHDIGEIYLGREILSRKSRLTDSEWKKLREHPRQSVEYLKRSGYHCDRVQSLILRHHERYDGSGYPYNITGRILRLEDCIMGITDMYMALISPRPHRNALTRREAMRMILSQQNLGFSQEYVKLFASIMGLYPPGSIVQLKGGGIVVVMNSPSNGRWPGLIVKGDASEKSSEEVDLNHLSGDYIVQEFA